LKSTQRHPRLVLHIGDPKTGTTTIQRVLHDRLISCPSQEILPWKRLNAIAVADSLKSDEESRRRKQFRGVRNWLNKSDADVAVVSSEFFASVKPHILKASLDAYLPDEFIEDLRIIAYVRPHASRFLAAFVQRTKTGQYFGDIEEFLTNLQNKEPLTFLFAKRFQRWESRFGDKFVLKPFIRSELRGGDIAEDFFEEILGSAPFTIEKKVEANIGVTIKSLAGLRRMHETLRDREVDAKTRGLLGGAMANHFLGSQAAGGEKPKLDMETAKGVVSTFRSDAKDLDAAFFGKPLMEESLERCVDDTRDQRIDLTAELHFSPDELASLDELSGRIAADIRTYRRLWALHYHMNHRKVRNYMIPPAEALIKLKAASKRVKAIDDQLQSVAEILGQ